jgi:hypothetical protein
VKGPVTPGEINMDIVGVDRGPEGIVKEKREKARREASLKLWKLPLPTLFILVLFRAQQSRRKSKNQKK